MTVPKYKDYYDLLGLSRDSDLSPDKIKKAFMVKAMKWHPDKAPTANDIPIYTKLYEDLQQAYKILSNDESRRQYTDSQQRTNIDLARQERDLTYLKSDQYVSRSVKGVTFDRDTFINDFETKRDKTDKQLLESAPPVDSHVTLTEYQKYMDSRDKDIQINNIFSANGASSNFNSDVFHQAFEYVKKNNPSQGLEEYVKEPSAMGLAELDNSISGINFGANISLAKGSYAGLEVGVAFNPVNLDLTKFSGDNTVARKPEVKLSATDAEKSIDKIMMERDRLLKLDKTEFTSVPSEIETLYSTLYTQKTEELDKVRQPVSASALTLTLTLTE